MVVIILSLLTLGMLSCEPDTTCRTEPEVKCYIAYQDTAKTFTRTYELQLSTTTEQTMITLTSVKDSVDYNFLICHTNDPHFISFACGCFVYSTIDTVIPDTPSRFKVEILNSAVPDQDKNNILIIEQR